MIGQNRNEMLPRFSLAQAFTPGTVGANLVRRQPLQGLSLRKPLKGLQTRVALPVSQA